MSKFSGEVIVTESSTTLSSRSTYVTMLSSIPVSENDERTERTYCLNVGFGMNPTVSLPPSTGNRQRVHVDRIESGYQFIAGSIRDILRKILTRSIHEISNDIITTIRERGMQWKMM